MTEHPITPPPELVQQWVAATESNDCFGAFPTNFEQRICIAAARWAADQELEACCEWIADNSLHHAESDLLNDLRAARRPQPKSLGKTALVALETIEEDLMVGDEAHPNDFVTIRRALERLQELEGRGDD